MAHWEIGETLQAARHGAGGASAGSMFPLYRGAGARLLRALTAFAIDRHSPAYEEIHPPTVVLTETMASTGHLPKSATTPTTSNATTCGLIPTAEVPLTSMHRGEILEESLAAALHRGHGLLPARSGIGGARHPRGCCGCTSSTRWSCSPTRPRRQALEVQADILARAESLLRDLGLPYRVLDLCTGDLGGSSARTFDLEAYAPGVDRWLEVSSVWWSGLQARRANVRYRPAGGGPAQLVHTVNGSALAWPRIWAALVENGRQEDGTLPCPRPGPLCRGRAADQGAMSLPGRPSGPGVGDRAGGRSGFGFDEAVDAIALESAHLAQVVAGSDLERRVPSCPEWSVRDLAHHFGTVQWSWSQTVRGAEPTQRPGGDAAPAPGDRDLLAWLGWCSYSLLSALRGRVRSPPAGHGGVSRARRPRWGATRPRRRRCTAGTPSWPRGRPRRSRPIWPATGCPIS